MSVKTNWSKLTSQNFVTTNLQKITIPLTSIFKEVLEQFSLWNDGNVQWQDINSNWEDL